MLMGLLEWGLVNGKLVRHFVFNGHVEEFPLGKFFATGSVVLAGFLIKAGGMVFKRYM